MEKLNQIKRGIIEKVVELYLYYIQGFEDGPRIEKRMLGYQKSFEKWCKRRGIALVAFKNKDDTIALSFVKEEAWDSQKEKVQQEVMDELLKEKGDEIESPYLPPEIHL
jgi:hypothetical protein